MIPATLQTYYKKLYDNVLKAAYKHGAVKILVRGHSIFNHWKIVDRSGNISVIRGWKSSSQNGFELVLTPFREEVR